MIPKQCILVLFLALGCSPNPRVPSECKGTGETIPSCQKLKKRLLSNWRSGPPRVWRESLLALAEWGDPIILPQLERLAVGNRQQSELLNAVGAVLAEPARSQAIENAARGRPGAEGVFRTLASGTPMDIAKVLNGRWPRSREEGELYLWGLSRAPEHVRALAPTLENLAKTHPRRDFRQGAADLIEKRTGRKVEVAPQACPISVELPTNDLESNVAAQARVELKTGTVFLTQVATPQPPLEPWCAEIMKRHRPEWGSILARAKGDACLLAYYFGHIGGKVEVHERTTRESYVVFGGDESLLFPFAFFDWGGEIWVFEGVVHMGIITGGSTLLLREGSDGVYRVAERFYFDGMPRAYKVDDDDSLLVLVQYGPTLKDFEASCPQDIKVDDTRDLVLVRLTRDGVQRAVE